MSVKEEGWTLKISGERRDGVLGRAVAALGDLSFASGLPYIYLTVGQLLQMLFFHF